MAELADAKDLGSFTSRCAGSSPVTRISFAHGMIEADHTVGIFIESSKTGSIIKVGVSAKKIDKVNPIR